MAISPFLNHKWLQITNNTYISTTNEYYELLLQKVLRHFKNDARSESIMTSEQLRNEVIEDRNELEIRKHIISEKTN